MYLKISPLSDFFERWKKKSHPYQSRRFQIAGPNIPESSGAAHCLNLLKAVELITPVRGFHLNCAPRPRSGKKSDIFQQKASQNVDFSSPAKCLTAISYLYTARISDASLFKLYHCSISVFP